MQRRTEEKWIDRIDYLELVKVLSYDASNIGPGIQTAPANQPVDCTLEKAIRLVVTEWPKEHGRVFIAILRDSGLPITAYEQARAIFERDDFPKN
jgi:hypothetical protein